MRKAILDTSFILDCVREKLDFFDQLESQGISPVIPDQVINELERVSNSKKKEKYRDNAKLALKILEKNEFEKPDIGEGHVDKRIKNYAIENPRVIVATMDRELKNKVSNEKIVIRSKSFLKTV